MASPGTRDLADADLPEAAEGWQLIPGPHAPPGNGRPFRSHHRCKAAAPAVSANSAMYLRNSSRRFLGQVQHPPVGDHRGALEPPGSSRWPRRARPGSTTSSTSSRAAGSLAQIRRPCRMIWRDSRVPAAPAQPEVGGPGHDALVRGGQAEVRVRGGDHMVKTSSSWLRRRWRSRPPRRPRASPPSA